MAVPFWTRGDLNAFFGLGINMLVNVLVLAGLCIGVVHMAPTTSTASCCPRSASSC